MLCREGDRMILTARFEAIGDTPDETRAYFLTAFERLGLGWGEVEDEVYQRNNEVGGYDGRIKMKWDAPMPARVEKMWFADEPFEKIAEEWNREEPQEVTVDVLVSGILWEVKVPTNADVGWIKRAAFTTPNHAASVPPGHSIDNYELRDAQGNLLLVNDRGQVFSAPQPLSLTPPAGVAG